MAQSNGRNHKWEGGLGTGGFGIVVSAQNLKMHNKVALKIIPLETKNHGDVLKAKVGLKINHKNVAQCHDIWSGQLNAEEVKELQNLVPKMTDSFQLPQMVDESSLLPVIYVEREFCVENFRLYLKTSCDPLIRRFDLFKEITSALDFLHSQGIVHGALKPENILVHRYVAQGQRTSCIKLGDAGLAQFATMSSSLLLSNSKLTFRRNLYQPPEQVMCRNYETSIDIFPLGILLFELMHLKSNQNRKEKGDENEDEFWTLLGKLICGLTKERKFPPDFNSDQFLSQLILEMTDKDVKKRPSATKIIEIFDISLRRNLTNWTRYSSELEAGLEQGDLIELNRVPCSHWGIYYGQGQLVHFSSAEEGQTKGSNVNYEKLTPALLSLTPMKDVAGVCLIRMNNRPEIRAKIRPLKSTLEILKILLERPAVYFYSVAYFNSEHFVTFLKFDGVSFSTQVATNTKVFGQIKMHRQKNQQDIQSFNQLAFEQWRENSSRGSQLKNHLEKGIKEIGGSKI